MEQNDNGEAESCSALIFLGTGCSATVPYAMCLLQPSNPRCQVCSQSLSIPPHQNPNYRCNTSLLIDYCQYNGEHSYILIDVGKTFREQVLRWFTFYKIPRIDSIILTHEHSDAILGLDDIHSVQPSSHSNNWIPTTIYLTQFTMDRVAELFPHLVEVKVEAKETTRVAQLDWKIIESLCDKPFVASGLQFFPLPVMHGEDYVSLGFVFGVKCRVAYVSDVSRFPPTSEYFISKSGAGQVDFLILDANNYKMMPRRSRGTHFCLGESLEAVKRICPKKALLIGMNHEFDYDSCNAFLMEWSSREGIPIQLAHDGLRIPIDL
ncbi:hypothetical protein Ancab_019056 [Ancistrocladus abbreviatus]